MQKVKNSIGESIRKLRKSQEISKSELAEITGISSSHMNKIELGIRNPSVVTCQKMLIASVSYTHLTLPTTSRV